MNRAGKLVILVFVVAVGAYLAVAWRAQSTSDTPKNPGLVSSSPKPTVDPTANWATYTSSDPALSVKYPAGWAVLRQPLPAILSNQPDITSQAPTTKFLLIDTRPGTSFDSCYAQTNYTQTNYTYTSKPVKVGSNSGSVYTIDPKPGSGKTGFATAYLFIKNGRCYDLALASLSAAARNQDAGLAETIAGTLKY